MTMTMVKDRKHESRKTESLIEDEIGAELRERDDRRRRRDEPIRRDLIARRDTRVVTFSEAEASPSPPVLQDDDSFIRETSCAA